jgi:hypothetical protein
VAQLTGEAPDPPHSPTPVDPSSDLPLEPAEVLSEIPLYGSDTDRAWGRSAALQECVVQAGRPFVVQLPIDDLPPLLQQRAASHEVAYLWVLFTCDLPELPRGRTLATTSLTVALDDPRCRAVGLNAADDVIDVLLDDLSCAVLALTAGPSTSALPKRAGRRTTTADLGQITTVHGLMSRRFGWQFLPAAMTGDLKACLPPIRRLAAGAVVEAPADLAELSGELDIRLTMHRSYKRLVQSIVAVPRAATRFTETLTVAALHAVPGEEAAARTIRLFVSTDVMGYSSRAQEQQRQAQADLVRVLDEAVAATGCRADVAHQDQGDCVLLVFPPATDEIELLPRFYAAFTGALDSVNANRPPDTRLRLRLGLDHGHTGRAAAGWDGQSVVAAARLRDCRQARAVLTRSAEVDFVLTVSSFVYQDVVRELDVPPVPASFVPIDADEPGKRYRAQAWLHVPDSGGTAVTR